MRYHFVHLGTFNFFVCVKKALGDLWDFQIEENQKGFRVLEGSRTGK